VPAVAAGFREGSLVQGVFSVWGAPRCGRGKQRCGLHGRGREGCVVADSRSGRRPGTAGVSRAVEEVLKPWRDLQKLLKSIGLSSTAEVEKVLTPHGATLTRPMKSQGFASAAEVEKVLKPWRDLDKAMKSKGFALGR